MKALSTINLRLNGQSQIFPENLNLPDLLLSLNLNPRLVAVEYNGEILARELWQQTFLVNDDRLEIVTIFGGG